MWEGLVRSLREVRVHQGWSGVGVGWPEHAVHRLANLRALTSLELSSCTLNSEQCTRLLTDCTALESVHIERCSSLTRVQVSASIAGLQRLTLRECHALTSVSLDRSLRLRKLYVNGCTNAAIECVATGLTHLGLAASAIPRDVLAALLDACADTLVVLNLDTVASLDDHVLNNTLGRAVDLDTLSVTRCPTVTAWSLATGDAASTRLRTIRASYTSLWSAVLPMQAIRMTSVGQLCELVIEHPNAAPNPSMLRAALAAAVDTLEVLRVSRVTGLAGSALAECQRLRVLRVANTDVYVEDVMSLITTAPALQEVDVAGCPQVTREELATALQRRPATLPPLRSLVEPDGLMVHCVQAQRLISTHGR
jgi:hypothetical protein